MTFMPNFVPTLNAIQEATGCDQQTARIAYERGRIQGQNNLDAMIDAAYTEQMINRLEASGTSVASILQSALAIQSTGQKADIMMHSVALNSHDGWG